MTALPGRLDDPDYVAARKVISELYTCLRNCVCSTELSFPLLFDAVGSHTITYYRIIAQPLEIFEATFRQ
jgi:hypothetical protein